MATHARFDKKARNPWVVLVGDPKQLDSFHHLKVCSGGMGQMAMNKWLAPDCYSHVSYIHVCVCAA